MPNKTPNATFSQHQPVVFLPVYPFEELSVFGLGVVVGHETDVSLNSVYLPLGFTFYVHWAVLSAREALPASIINISTFFPTDLDL